MGGAQVFWISAAGDINGDTFDDLIVSSSYYNKSYLVFGGAHLAAQDGENAQVTAFDAMFANATSAADAAVNATVDVPRAYWDASSAYQDAAYAAGVEEIHQTGASR